MTSGHYIQLWTIHLRGKTSAVEEGVRVVESLQTMVSDNDHTETLCLQETTKEQVS